MSVSTTMLAPDPPGDCRAHDVCLPDKTVVYGPGEFFFESGDINHTVFNKTDAPMVHVLFEILPVDMKGPSLIPVQRN